MKITRSSFISICILFISFSTLAQQGSFVRNPSISPDGNKIAFVFQGDIWTADNNGQNAKRLTIHEAYDQSPVWSPDNKMIAFSSDRFGNNDIYTIDANGSAPKRITFHSTQDLISSWTDNYGLLAQSNRTFKHVERESELIQVPATGGTPFRAFNSVGFEPQPSPNGKYIAFVRGTCRISREAYRGAANREIWLYNTNSKSYNKITNFDGNDFNPRWIDDSNIAFISSRNGKYNVFKLNIDATGMPQGQPQSLTSFNDYGVMSMNIGGNTIILEQFDKVWKMPVAGGNPVVININIGADYRFDPIEHKTYAGDVSEYLVSPNGKLMALVIRGEVFVKLNDKEKSRTVRLTNNPYRDQDIAWLNDSTLLFTSDREGKFNMYMISSSDQNETNIFRTLKTKVSKILDGKDDISNPRISPDGEKIAYNEGRGKLIVALISSEGKINKPLSLLDGWATASGVSWSPDSKWVAYSLDDLNFNEEVYIHAADNSTNPVNISMHPRGDYNPVWSKDGSKLGFISTRNNGDADVWFAWLNKEDWEKTKQDWEEEDEDEGKNGNDKKKNGKDKKTIEPIKIDFKDIHYRLSQVTSLPGNEGNLNVSQDGELFFFTNNGGGRMTYRANRDLYKIKWDGTEQKPLTKGGTSPFGVDLGPEGKKLYFIKRGGKISSVDIAKATVDNLGFSAKMVINHPEEREQIFGEAWRTLDAGFYDPGFHNQDFSNLKEKYHDWAISASTQIDFHYVFNLMLGQLNASHMGLYGSGMQDTQRERTGLLGVDIMPEKNGVRITRVIPKSPADREGSKININDIIKTIDGQPVSSTKNFYIPLSNKINEKVILEVINSIGQNREVIIRPTGSINTLLYDEWVADRRALTEKYSNGQLGYIHIRGMNWTSFEQFERELTASGQGKKGLVIDVRFNGGGWTTDYLMAVLNVKQHAYTIPRGAASDLEKEHTNFTQYYPYGERLPLAAWTKPAVALCNANSYSNAEIFSHAFKTLDRGTLVGVPTFGAVISTGGQGLINGSYVRLPFRAWYVLATKTSMENIPAVPDIVINNTPDSKSRGVDEQLKKAVDTLLGEIR